MPLFNYFYLSAVSGFQDGGKDDQSVENINDLKPGATIVIVDDEEKILLRKIDAQYVILDLQRGNPAN